MALRQTMQRLASQVFLDHLTLELDAVGAVSCHELASFRSPAPRSIPQFFLVRPKGPIPNRGHNCTSVSTSRRERKKVEMLFAHLKRILKLDRLRLRGPDGARDEFLLAATAQNLRKLAKTVPMAETVPA
jgi:hypothetical protein